MNKGLIFAGVLITGLCIWWIAHLSNKDTIDPYTYCEKEIAELFPEYEFDKVEFGSTPFRCIGTRATTESIVRDGFEISGENEKIDIHIINEGVKKRLRDRNDDMMSQVTSILGMIVGVATFCLGVVND